MKKTKETIALLFNVRRINPNLKDPQSHRHADYDDPEMTKLQIKYLKKLGYKIIPIEANEKAYLTLYKHRKEIDLALNLSEGVHGKDRECQLPAMLEMLQIPYTGSPPLAQALMLDKAKAKEVLIANNIPTLQFLLLGKKPYSIPKSFKFPLIVKPVSEGSSAGVSNQSVVYNDKQLRKRIAFVHRIFHEKALVEPYLEGREFSVAMLGNPPKILPIIESDHRMLPKKYMPFDSFEVKWFYEYETNGEHLVCPARLSSALKKKIERICLALWNAIGILDWCRIDIRCDKKENPYVLEVNSPPGCTPPEYYTTSYLPLAARAAGIEYDKLLSNLIKTTLKRYSK
ncbi:MAG: ATP-grasp domain-containing protein [Patescibacteria group bacterium]